MGERKRMGWRGNGNGENGIEKQRGMERREERRGIRGIVNSTEWITVVKECDHTGVNVTIRSRMVYVSNRQRLRLPFMYVCTHVCVVYRYSIVCVILCMRTCVVL